MFHRCLGPCGLLFVLVNVGAAQAGGDFDLTWNTIDGGGKTHSTGGEFELGGTIGQPDARIMSGGVFELTGGFWFRLEPGDCNSDGGVDLFDYADFADCVSGSGGGYNSLDCGCFDFDGDNDIDLHDWGTFQNVFTTGEQPVEPLAKHLGHGVRDTIGITGVVQTVHETGRGAHLVIELPNR